MSISHVKPIEDGIIFKFLESITNKAFDNNTSWGFVITERLADPHSPRWVEVLAVGPKTHEVKVGDYVLVENLQWTAALDYAGEKFWKTNESRVIMVSEEMPKEFA